MPQEYLNERSPILNDKKAQNIRKSPKHKVFRRGWTVLPFDPISEGGGLIQPPLTKTALNQVIWWPGPPKLIDFS